MTAPFPSSSGSKQMNLDQAWNFIRGMSAQVKSRATSLRNAAVAGNISSSSILDFATFLADAKLQMNAVSGLTGLVAYAQAQLGDNTFDIAGSYNAMVAQIDATTAWIIANFPASGGLLLAKSFTADNTGRTQDVQFNNAQTAGFQTVLSSLAAAID